MKTRLGLLIAMLLAGAASADDAVVDPSKHLGLTPALVVVVCESGAKDLPDIAEMVKHTPWTIFCRGAASAEMNTLRDWARDKGILGKRVYVADDDGPSLWLAGDMADAVWVAPGVKNPPLEKEILRVLHPGGIFVCRGKVAVKPAAADTDEWRHPYHEPDNNVVSRDRVARLPGELRFQTYPVFAPMPNQTLFAGGRMFFFTGQIAFHEREEPLLNTLTVLNAYNGLRLWSRPLDPRYVVQNFVKTGDRPRRGVRRRGNAPGARRGDRAGAGHVPRPRRSGRRRRHRLEVDRAGQGQTLGPRSARPTPARPPINKNG